jgi:transposase
VRFSIIWHRGSDCTAAGTQIWLAAGVTDMRRGMHGPAALVQMVLLENVYGGHVFVFRGRKGDLLKGRAVYSRRCWRVGGG